MARLGRLGTVLLIASLSLLAAGARVAHAGCAAHPTDPGCMPSPEPTTEPSSTPKSTPQPTTTASATSAPTAAPTQHPARTAAPAPGGNSSTTPEPTFDVEVPSANPEATPRIVVNGPLDDSTDFQVAEPAASASSWIFGFIVGFLVGAIIGRASWGLRKRRRQQIFG